VSTASFHKSHAYTNPARVAESTGSTPVSSAPPQEVMAHSDNQMEVMLKQMHDLMARIESLQADGAGQIAA
jgi:hypothetical protein